MATLINIAEIKLLKGGWHYGHGRHHDQQDSDGDEPEYDVSIQHLAYFSPPPKGARQNRGNYNIHTP
jgi:hypothetical protein